jgi:hypothetical protein
LLLAAAQVVLITMVVVAVQVGLQPIMAVVRLQFQQDREHTQ